MSREVWDRHHAPAPRTLDRILPDTSVNTSRLSLFFGFGPSPGLLALPSVLLHYNRIRLPHCHLVAGGLLVFGGKDMHAVTYPFHTSLLLGGFGPLSICRSQLSSRFYGLWLITLLFRPVACTH